tara:strand:- start:1210 stop:1620 length:411 start_codon:yes stop_codon:yes gene_type:complete
MRLKEGYVDSNCKTGAATGFLKSVTSQLGGIFGFSSALNHTGIDVMKELMEKINELQSQLKTVEWQCTQKLILEQDETNKDRLQMFNELKDYINVNNNYIDNKYILREERLGLLEGALSILTTLVVFVILNFLKFK